MATADKIRNSIIDKLLTISNKDYLVELNKLIENNSINDDTVKLTKEQKLMLELSDNDIREERIISQDQLNQDDLEWLNKL